MLGFDPWLISYRTVSSMIGGKIGHNNAANCRRVKIGWYDWGSPDWFAMELCRRADERIVLLAVQINLAKADEKLRSH